MPRVAARTHYWRDTCNLVSHYRWPVWIGGLVLIAARWLMPRNVSLAK